MFDALAEYEAAIRADERLKIAREIDAMPDLADERLALLLIEVAERIREPRA
jgi:hypothetical protein